MEIIEKKFNDLDVEELYELLKLREEVFVIEQKCSCVDLDGFDLMANHIFIKKDNKIISYARLFDKNTRYKYASIGRMCTSKEYRKKGIGKILMEKSLKSLKLRANDKVVISSQSYAEGFYSKLGFKRTDKEPYMEENIPHVEMILKLEKISKWKKKAINL